MHLGPDRRVDAVRADQQPGGRLRRHSVGLVDEGDHAVFCLSVTRDAAAHADGLRPQPFDHLVVQQHLQPAAMDRILRPVVARRPAAGLGIDVVAVQPDQRPFLRRDADPVEVRLSDAEVVEFAHRIGLQIDADAQRAHLAHRLDDHAGRADLMQRQGRRQAADAAAGDNHERVCHLELSVGQPAVRLAPQSRPEQAEACLGG